MSGAILEFIGPLETLLIYPHITLKFFSFQIYVQITTEMVYINSTMCTKTPVTRNRLMEKLAYGRSRFFLACFQSWYK